MLTIPKEASPGATDRDLVGEYQTTETIAVEARVLP